MLPDWEGPPAGRPHTLPPGRYKRPDWHYRIPRQNGSSAPPRLARGWLVLRVEDAPYLPRIPTRSTSEGASLFFPCSQKLGRQTGKLRAKRYDSVSLVGGGNLAEGARARKQIAPSGSPCSFASACRAATRAKRTVRRGDRTRDHSEKQGFARFEESCPFSDSLALSLPVCRLYDRFKDWPIGLQEGVWRALFGQSPGSHPRPGQSPGRMSVV
jgi:hypothetical protein